MIVPRSEGVQAFSPSHSGSNLWSLFGPPTPWHESWRRRAFDTTVALLAVLLLAPLLLFIALLIRLTSSGPAIFRQTRVGVYGRDFTILKFRTMRRGAPGSQRSVSTDQRITPLGQVLRRHKLDELPQLLNVVAGQMCLIGPRPKLRGHHSVDWHLRPGITGAASVAFAAEERLLCNVPENELEECHRQLITPRKMEIDLRYAANASFRSDLRLLLMTVLRAGRYLHLDELGGWAPSAATQETTSLVGASIPSPLWRSAGTSGRTDQAPIWETGTPTGALFKTAESHSGD